MTHPLTRLLFEEMRAEGLSVATVAKRSGLAFETIYNWKRRGGSGPTVANLEACFHVLGLQFSVSRVPCVQAEQGAGIIA